MGAPSPLEAVVSLELRLLDPSIRARPEEVGRLLHDDFTEVGPTGRLWDRASILAALAADPGSRLDVRDVTARALADSVVLVTYLVTVAGDPATASFRSSIWLRDGGTWKVRFHQGTPRSLRGA
jgi:ribonuclease HI